MNKRNKIFGLITCLIASVLLFVLSCDGGCPPPDKPKSLPKNSFWFGGCDGGNWIELVNTNESKNLIRFKIYRDYDGALEMDADFNLGNCDFTDINESNWKENIVGYINETISLKGEKDCFLKPIYPAYGGEEWEILKNKKKE